MEEDGKRFDILSNHFVSIYYIAKQAVYCLLRNAVANRDRNTVTLMR